MTDMQEKGSISIHTENIFPIIKKFLYSDHEIFLRELVSNAVDASQKIEKLSSIGQYQGEVGALKVSVAIDKEAGTLTISDNGIGMTAEEIKKYINQIAFSGATEFIEKYKDAGAEKQIIGHFGLGFYSAFMVASNVEINTLSYQENAASAKWICDGSTEFEITAGNRTERGTSITLYIAEDSKEFLETERVKGILDKYCRFLPVDIEFEGEIINNKSPLWTKNPSELTDEDYKNFYKELYPFSAEPLFWIHLNVDYPFNLTGILYFPQVKNEFEIQKNKIQLYSRQVFITDEVKDVVPDFLMLMHGVLDSPDIPLNVSRSFLQSDGNVKKINAHITKKVADKLSEISSEQPTIFEEKWNDIALFVKYGMLSEDKFYEKAKDFCLVQNIENKYFKLEAYKEQIAANQTDKNGQIVALYTNDEGNQDMFIRSATKKGYDVLKLNTVIDSHFVGLLEQKLEKFSLKRVDADGIEKLIEKDVKLESILSKEEEEKAQNIFKEVLPKADWNVSIEALPADEMPVSVVLPEFMRRMKEMSANGGGAMMGGAFPEVYQVVVNSNHPVIKKILDTEASDNQKQMAKQALDLGLLAQSMLKGKDLSTFIDRSLELVF